MTVNELRIGNLVHKMQLNIDSGKYEFPIVPVDLRILFDLVNNKTTIEPIPITGGLLLKAGFKKSKMPNNPKLMEFTKGDFIIYMYEEIEIYYGCYTYVKIKYIHQLQNLFFDLSGEELTFKSE